ncbi:ferritin-like domain-containing protein [Sphingomonas pseudosanguinis]|uniref:ferritin-like domain-containing protein n=1 Tax=Sphingomonas pseudosanguinis TaxID=413712 RepID=UPI003F84E20A
MKDFKTMSDERSGLSGAGRREFFAAMLAGVALAGAAGSASAQVSASVDTAPLQFALNLHYLSTNMLQLAIYGKDRQLPAQFIRGGETVDQPGVSATSAKQVAFPEDARDIQARIQEIADSLWYRTLLLRALLRADSPAQKQIDMTAERFTAMFRLAGAIGPNESFDPYASPVDLALAAETILAVQATALNGLVSQYTNSIVKAAMVSMAATAATDVTTVRTILMAASTSRPAVLTMVDRLAAWRNGIDGAGITDRGMSPVTANGMMTTRLSLTDDDGLLLSRTPAQALNVLFMTSAATTQGGFFPTGINGSIKTSAAN